MADTSVKFIHSAMAGAPVLSGTAGAAIAVLDACLVNGFGLISVDSVVIAGGVATVNKSTGHSFEVGSVALIAGATPAGLNGEQKVTAVTGTSFSFATALADQTATGTITAKLAPLGWTKPFSGTNLAAYKSSDPSATGCLLRLDDTSATNMRVVGYETMSDINTGTGPFPTATQRSGGSYWTKSSAAGSTAKNWILIGDGKLFYFANEVNPSSYAQGYWTYAFGDVVPTKSGDAFSCVLVADATDISINAPNQSKGLWYVDNTSSVDTYMPRSYTGTGGSVQVRKCAPSIAGSSASYTSGNYPSAQAFNYPNPADNGLYIVPLYLVEHVLVTLRGTAPGAYICPQTVADGQFAAKDTVTNVAAMSGRTLKALTCSNSARGVMFFDTTGPWR